MKAVLIDDEKNALTALRKMIGQFCSGVEVTGEAQTAMEGLQLIRRQQPDLVFLDVEMPGGTGFDLLEAIEKKNFAVIFTTAYEHYAIPALRTGAADYLLKPISIDELRKAIERVQTLKLKNTIASPEAQRVRIANAEGTLFVPVTDITCIKGEGRYSRFFLQNGEEQLVARNLGELEEELSPARFFRLHKSWLVNCASVVRITHRDGGFAVLTDGREIEISRRKKAEFLQLLNL